MVRRSKRSISQDSKIQWTTKNCSNGQTAFDYMDLFIYKSNSFYLDGKLSISIHQKEISKFLYIPFRFVSFHQQHTIKNIVLGRALCVLQFGSRFLLSLRNNGIKKYIHAKLFQHVTYLLRDKLFNTKLPLPNVCEPLIILEAEGGFFWKERQHSAFRKGTRQLPILVSIPRISDFLSTTSNSNNTTAQQDTRTFGHHQA